MADSSRFCVDWETPGRVSPYSVASPGTLRRQPLAVRTDKVWRPGTVLSVRFVDHDDEALLAEVLALARRWTTTTASVAFAATDAEEADVRIAVHDTVYATKIGTDARSVSDPNQPTMILGGLHLPMSDREFRAAVLHEFGHALGAIHEHQHPKSGIPWDREAVYAIYGRPPNRMSPAEVDENIFRRYEADQLNFTAFDPSSIMMYPIPGTLTKGKYWVDWNTELSHGDRKLIAAMYPGNGPAAHPQVIPDAGVVTVALPDPRMEVAMIVEVVTSGHYVLTQTAGDRIRVALAPAASPGDILATAKTRHDEGDLLSRHLDKGRYQLTVAFALPSTTGLIRLRLASRP